MINHSLTSSSQSKLRVQNLQHRNCCQTSQVRYLSSTKMTTNKPKNPKKLKKWGMRLLFSFKELIAKGNFRINARMHTLLQTVRLESLTAWVAGTTTASAQTSSHFNWCTIPNSISRNAFDLLWRMVVNYHRIRRWGIAKATLAWTT